MTRTSKSLEHDYASAPAITKVLQEHNIDVLISAVSLVTGGVATQDVPADAAKAAGVKLFVPKTGTFYVAGGGNNATTAFSATNHVAGYLAYVLTTQVPSRLIDAELHIEGQRATLADLGAMYNGKVPVVHVDIC
ncbi:hypothetical protein BU15DRAFT_74246 [Melanogaster broomeanus]|nr:hypothetical protein BU15DRAFT_74246 [Melanogaster broomeanus]